MIDDTPGVLRRWRMTFAAVVVWTAAVPIFAQAPPAAGPRSPGTVDPPSPKASQLTDATYGILRPEDGTVAPLPPGTTYEDFLAWIAARRGPGYGVNSVTLTARPADESRFEVDAEVRLVVHRAGEWVRVPLRFDEAVLTACEHQGEGALSYARAAGETGHAWSFDAAGEHTLKLKLLVSASVRSDETRFALSTPTDAAVTTLRFALPLAADVTAGTGLIRSATEAEGATQVDWVGPGGRIDLAWRPEAVAADLESLVTDTTIIPAVAAQAAQLRVRQRVRAEAGEVTEVTVSIPSEYTVADVTGALFRSRRDEVRGQDRLVTIQLSEPTAGPFELNWQVTAPLSADGRLVLRGFSVPGVPDESQIGRVLVEQAGGYRIYAPADGAFDGVKTMEMVDPESQAVAAAYEFDRQPFRLELKAEPVPPEFTSSRKVTVAVSPEGLALDAEFGVEVTKGEIKDLELIWPAPGWTVSPIRGANVSEGKRTPGTDAIGLRLTSPAARFSVPVKAGLVRDVTAGETPLTLPRLAGKGLSQTAGRETLLAFRHGDGFEIGVEARGTGGAVRQVSESAMSLGLADPPAGEKWTIFRASPDTTSIAITVRRLPLSVTVAVTAAIRPQGDGLRVEERFNYEIRHGSISTARLTSPRGIVNLRVTDGQGRVLTPAEGRGASEADGGPQLMIPLPEAVTGSTELTVAYHVPPGTGRNDELRVPLVRPLGVAIGSASLGIDPPARRQAQVTTDGWDLRTAATAGVPAIWTSADLGEAVTIRFSPSEVDAAEQADVPKVLLRTSITREGVESTVADCKLDRPPRFLTLGFESDAPDEFAWNGRPVVAHPLPSDHGTVVELDVGNEPGPGVLSMTFPPTTRGTAGVAERLSVPVFRFGGGVTVGETAWRVNLPESQHLFTAPAGYEPRFRWTLRNGLWTRRPSPPYDDLAAWFGEGASEAGDEAGHQYVFSRDGGPRTLAFSVVSRSLVVLVGAGTAIVLGYLFANSLIPRRGVALAALAFVFALLFGFFQDQVQIFLQPAAFGLLLVTVAAVAERLLRKRQERFASVNPASAVDFVTILPGEGSTSAPQASIGSEEPTVLRPGRPPASEPVSAHGSGAAS